MTSTKPRLILFAIVMISALPLLQALLVSTHVTFSHWRTTQLALILMYSTPAWATAVLIFILDAFRADAMQESAITWHRCALRLAGLGLLITVIALAINPVVKELSMQSLVYLGMLSPVLGFAGGALFWLLTYRNS